MLEVFEKRLYYICGKKYKELICMEKNFEYQRLDSKNYTDDDLIRLLRLYKVQLI